MERSPSLVLSQIEQIKKKRAFKKFTYRGVDLDKLLDLSLQETLELLPARIRRRFGRGITRKHTTLLKKLRKAVRLICACSVCVTLAHAVRVFLPVQKKDVKGLEKPEVIKTHLRDMPIIPGTCSVNSARAVFFVLVTPVSFFWNLQRWLAAWLASTVARSSTQLRSGLR
jgi:ribosomal protein S19